MTDVVAHQVPGLVDLHVHSAGGFWASDPTRPGRPVAAVEGDLRAMARGLRAAGTTAFCPTSVTGPAADLLVLCQAAAQVMGEPRAGEARVLGVHAEGPWLSPVRLGAQRAGHVRPPDVVELTALVATGALNRVTLAPEVDPGFVSECVARGVRVSLGHSDATFDEARAAVDAGASAVTHTFNAMRPLLHRDPGLAGLALTDERVVAEVVADGEHVHPAVVRILLAARPGGVAVVSDAVAGPGCCGAARLPDGTLAGSSVTMAVMFANLVRWGVAQDVAVAACSTTPARAAGLTGTVGTVLLDGDLRVCGVA